MPYDPDRVNVTRPLVDGRHTMLEVSMFRHLQFDSLRRAKYGTAMLLYHLHFPSHSLDAHCSGCGEILEGLRWHCATCTDYDVCGACSKRSGACCPEKHPLTPYHVSSFEVDPPSS
jgi:E1A/CREB-binding protein